MRIRPPGPTPPHGEGEPGCLDLGILMRDSFYRHGYIAETARDALAGRLDAALGAGQYALASRLLAAFLDTWPVAACADRARSAWTMGPDAAALAILGRVAEIIALATNWPTSPEGPWPLPDAAWIRSTVPEGLDLDAVRIERRGYGDGAEQVHRVLGGGNIDPEPPPPPEITVLPGDELVTRRNELCRALAREEILALRWTSPVPSDNASRLALGEVRLEGACEEAFERYGVAGLEVTNVRSWRGQLHAAPAGKQGRFLHPCCDALLLPGTPASLSRGRPTPVGWLLWDGPHPPIPVEREAMLLLWQLDGATSLDEIASRLGAPNGQVLQVAEELMAVGALCGAEST